jgi:hypothetical protein
MHAEEIFLAAVERTAPAERAAYLESACGGDAALRARVDGLLRAHEEAGAFLEEPLFIPAFSSDLLAAAEKPGAKVGPCPTRWR